MMTNVINIKVPIVLSDLTNIMNFTNWMNRGVLKINCYIIKKYKYVLFLCSKKVSYNSYATRNNAPYQSIPCVRFMK